MEETDPAQVLPGKKQIVETTSAPGSVGPAPMMPMGGMPMSPNSPAGTPVVPLSGDGLSPALPAEQAFGSPAVFLPQEHQVASLAAQPVGTLHAAIPATPGVPVSPGIPAEQPRILPIDDTCTCCGKVHEGRETRDFTRDDERDDRHDHDRHHDRHHDDGDGRDDRHHDEHRDHDRHHDGRSDDHDHGHRPDHEDRYDSPQHATHRGDSEGETTEPAGESTSDPCCACCGDSHPGLEDGKPGTGTGESEEDSEDGDSDRDGDSDKDDSSDKDDDCPADDSDDKSGGKGDDDGEHGDGDKPGKDGDGKHDDSDSDRPGKHDGKDGDSDKPGKDGGKDDDDCPADGKDDHPGKGDHLGKGDDSGKGDHPGKPDGVHGGDGTLPPTAPGSKLPLTPNNGSPTGDSSSPQLPGKPTIPGKPADATTPAGVAVAQKEPAAGPRGTMAPPVSEKLTPLSPTTSIPKTFSKSEKPPTPQSGGRGPAATGGAPVGAGGIPIGGTPGGTPGGAPGSVSGGSPTPLVPPVGGGGAPPVQEKLDEPLQRGQLVQEKLAPVSGSTPAYTSAPPPAYQPAGVPDSTGQTTPTTAFSALQATPALTSQPGVTTGGVPLPGTNGYGGNTGPLSGNVGPDPNIKFDEASYNQLTGVIQGVYTSLDGATYTGSTYLDAELKLQPNGQTWEPALNLVTRGGQFGGSVDMQSKTLERTLKTFHVALESAKEVFKDTDDLAAYDATKFSSEYPGFNGVTGV